MPHLQVKHKDWEAGFRLDQAKKEAAALPPPTQPSEPTPEETDKFKKLVSISPRSAVIEKSREVEQALAEFSEAMGMKGAPQAGWLYWTRTLRNNKLIDPTLAGLLDDLRALRNTAVHGAR